MSGFVIDVDSKDSRVREKKEATRGRDDTTEQADKEITHALCSTHWHTDKMLC